MPRRSTSALSIDHTKIAQLLGLAWTRADTLQRQYPRVFAKAMAEALELDKDATEAFVNLMTQEVESIEQERRGSGFGTT